MNTDQRFNLVIACFLAMATASLQAESAPPSNPAAVESPALVDFFPANHANVLNDQGTIAIKFVHNLDPEKFHFAAVAETTSGQRAGNLDSTSVPAPATLKPLLYSLDGLATSTEVTIHFKDAAPSTLKRVTVFLFPPNNEPLKLYLLLDPNFATTKPRTKKLSGPLRLETHGETNRFVTPEGLSIETHGAFDYTSEAGKITDIQTSSGMVKDPTGAPLLSSGCAKLLYNINPQAIPLRRTK